MSSLKVLLVGLLLMSFSFDTQVDHKAKSDCNKLTIKTEVTKLPGQDLSHLTIKVTGGKEPYYYVLVDKAGKPASLEFKKNEFDKLKKGQYRCVISDSEDCTKEILVEVN